MTTARTFAVLALAAIAGLVGYQVGVAQNIAAQLPVAAAPVAQYGYPYWHVGFGFIGILFPIFFVLLFMGLVMGLVRAAVGGGHGGHWEGRRHRLEELHRELHRDQGPGTPSST